MSITQRRLIVFFVILFISIGLIYSDTYNLDINAGLNQGTLNKFWQECVGSTHMGMINESHYHDVGSTIPLNLREAYKIAANDLGFKKVRGHGILCDDVGIYHEDSNGNPYYDWDKYDELMDYIIYECNLRPIVELSFMPYELARDPWATVFWYAGNTGPPKDWNKWQDLIYEVVKHSYERYGIDIVNEWSWEVWNEPNIGFWSGSEYEYHVLYDHAVEGAIRAETVIGNGAFARVGGPAVDGSPSALDWNTSDGWIKRFLEHCAYGTNYANGGTGTRLNILTYHLYPDNRGQVGDGSYYADYHTLVYNLGESFSEFDLEYYYTETGSSYVVFGGTHGYLKSHDTAQSASFALQSIHNLLDNGSTPPPDIWSYWVISDIWEEGFQEPGDKLAFYGIMGMILRKDDIYKPAYHAFEMLNKMGDNRIDFNGGSTRSDNKGVNGFATISNDNSQIQVIIYNQDYYNGSTHPDDTLSDTVNINISNIPFASGKAHVEIYGVDKYKSNTWTIWENQGQPEYPTEEEWSEIRDGQYIEYIKSPGETTLNAGTFSDSFTAFHTGVYLYILTNPDTYPKPDLVVTDITWSPEDPIPGSPVTFSARVKNIGVVGTTEGQTIGLAFEVDGTKRSWSANYNTSIPPEAEVVLTASGGPSGPTWTAISGTFDISAWVDDTYSIPEIDDNNNRYDKSLHIGASNDLPPDWESRDVGYVSAGGSASYENGDFYVTGSGKDIWGKKDEFHYVCKEGYGDCTVIARVNSLENTEQWAKAGIMIRESMTDNSKFADVVVTPSNGVSFQWRTSNVGHCTASTGSGSAPEYIKLVRADNNFSAYSSEDGINWIQIGSTVHIYMAEHQFAGLSVTSTNDGVLNIANFSNVSVDFQYILGNGDGLSGEYYDNMDLTNLRMDRVDRVIDYDWGWGSPDWAIDSDTYSVRWTGKIIPFYSEEYTFYTRSDDGVRLWVDGILIIDKWINQGATEWSGKIDLTAYVDYDIVLEYYENGGGANVSLSWESSLQVKEIIPMTQLKSGRPDLIITDISWMPQTPIAGDEILFSATVKNIGTGSSPMQLHGLCFKIDGDSKTWVANNTTSISVGGSVVMTASDGLSGATWTTPQGTFVLQAWVDDLNTIIESNDNNNTSSMLFFANEDPDSPPKQGVYYSIISKHSGKVLDVSGASTNSGANIQQWDNNGTDAQKFEFVDVGSGYYKIINKNSGKVIDVSGASTDDGANIQQWDDNGSSAQQFLVEDIGNGYFKIIIKNSGKCVDVDGVSVLAGANIHQWTYYGNDNQLWQLVE